MTDETDKALLAVLKANARMPVAEIARRLALSRSTVQDRLRKLEERGIIKGYALVVDDAYTQNAIRAFVTIMVEPQKTGIIVKELSTLNAVDAIFTVSGNFDLLVELSGMDIAAVDAAIDRISDIPGVNKTETSIVLSTKLKR